ncbi:hypothetical protein AX16_009373 [Volvariella volvacea WC 439]|nr:hypothetical protein AX16_009373 [Volvariella volvacea WC 439]
MPELQTRTLRKRPNTKEQSRALTVQNNNSEGLLSFPAEILVEIANHFPAAAVPSRPVSVPVSVDAETRGSVIRKLCQVCRAFRQIFRFHAWRNIEMLYSHCAKDNRRLAGVNHHYFYRWEKDIAHRTLRLFELAAENPSLAERVESLNILLTSYSYDVVLPEIAQGLSLFPNLRAFQLHPGRKVPIRNEQLYIKAFSEQEYPSIEVLGICPEHFILAQICPHLRQLQIASTARLPSISQGLPNGWLLKPEFPAKEILNLHLHRGLTEIQGIAAAMPKLRVLKISEEPDASSMDVYLSRIQRLSCLRCLSDLVEFQLVLTVVHPLYQRSCEDAARDARAILDGLPRVINGQMKCNVIVKTK